MLLLQVAVREIQGGWVGDLRGEMEIPSISQCISPRVWGGFCPLFGLENIFFTSLFLPFSTYVLFPGLRIPAPRYLPGQRGALQHIKRVLRQLVSVVWTSVVLQSTHQRNGVGVVFRNGDSQTTPAQHDRV